MNRESHLVELVDATGTAVGKATVDESHRAPGKLHRAFSVMLIRDDGQLLLQRRAAAKTRFPLRWANSCCGHPAPGTGVTESAALRLREELGVNGVPLAEVGVHLYQATDPTTNRVEYEYDHVLTGQVTGDLALRPDPAEVAEVRWVALADLRADLARTPEQFAPWLPGVLAPLLDSP